MKFGYLSVATGSTQNAVTTGSELASPNLRADHFQPQLQISEAELDKQPLLAFSAEFLRWMLSDGAGAVWMDHRPNEDRLSLRIDWIDLVSFAHESDVCMYSGMHKHNDGSCTGYRVVDPDVFVRDGYLNLVQDVGVLQERLPQLMSRAIQRTIAKQGLTADQVDWLLPHYSSQWFRQPLFDGLCDLNFEIPYDRWYSNLATKGNTGSASIYIMLDELLASGQIEPGHRLLCLVPESARMTFAVMLLTAV